MTQSREGHKVDPSRRQETQNKKWRKVGARGHKKKQAWGLGRAAMRLSVQNAAQRWSQTSIWTILAQIPNRGGGPLPISFGCLGFGHHFANSQLCVNAKIAQVEKMKKCPGQFLHQVQKSNS